MTTFLNSDSIYRNVKISASMQEPSNPETNSVSSPSISLPEELLREHIVPFLPLKDLAQVARVCKAWYKIAGEQLQYALDVIELWKARNDRVILVLKCLNYDRTVPNIKDFDISINSSMLCQEVERAFSTSIKHIYNRNSVIDPRYSSLSRDERELLQGLFIDYSRLHSIPKSIVKLEHLFSVNFRNNFISSIPEEVGNLQQLTILILKDNLISFIPKTIGNLKSLTELNLSHNFISFIPETIGNLESLTALNLSHNLLSLLSEWIGNLGRLKQLNASHNCLISIPNTICKLSRLEHLHLNNNHLTTVTSEMVEGLRVLLSFDLSHNRLSSLPEWSENLTHLAWINAGYNCLTQ